jgi:hypothetical protein
VRQRERGSHREGRGRGGGGGEEEGSEGERGLGEEEDGGGGSEAVMVEEEVVVGEEEVTERRRGRCDDRCLEGSQVSASPGHTPKGRRGVVVCITVQLPL